MVVAALAGGRAGAGALRAQASGAFAHPLGAVINVATVGRDGAKALVHIVYGIPGENLSGAEDGGYWRYPVTLRFAAYDSSGQVVASADTTAVLATPARVAVGSMLFGRFVVAVPPGRWAYRLALAEGDSTGTETPGDSLVVPAFDSGGLVMSDAVLGWRRISLTWLRGADTVYLSPFHAYFGVAELELYYEVYGLPAGSSYQTEIRVLDRRRKPGDPPLVEVRFGGMAAAGLTSGRRTIDLTDFRPGAYWLELIVTDRAGRHVERRTWFEVTPTPRSRA